MSRNFVTPLWRLVMVLALACGQATIAQKGKPMPPFAIDKRPQPSGTDLDKLVPVTVGTFKREPFPAGTSPRSDEDLNTTYKSGADSVFFGFSIPDTPADAHEAIKVTRDEAIASKVNMKGEQYVIGKEPSYFKVPDFMSWSRERYFFYAKASSPAALENFMRVFPY